MNWNYIAGFFDGEGTFSIKGRCVRIGITQTNKEVLEKIQKFIGFGNTASVTKRKPHWKDCWIYYISNQKDVYIFLRNVEGALVVKRNLVQKHIKQIKSNIRDVEKKKIMRQQRIKRIITLREKGLTYRMIGKEVGIDFGYVRRLLLNNRK